ncbi:Cell division cycle protein 20 [Monocercomonoides exilis]|uniref:Cell division cycle protein 20 n=1 Tax=Monocercomonoides exilis TaxID=2049356 RepID=UPI0035596C5C|nr:Cell division cycle protein 20 [Monocercomonoides exilis]|eukprot:MONOS_7504.1-p1 / transcript=MONOS_7504.1 / gene=MONOS_7504 / organism=Monocercomonoides_exilis_PA203 / gene_product=Cell division cycle protein 20 / transcript_product=Cell division cycle protein 20 / location=Mono_scaffold00258:2827-4086(+) / protein_length=375 / sequence_SO=supercontig / SO=protein_coding / is_pseudo=false
MLQDRFIRFISPKYCFDLNSLAAPYKIQSQASTLTSLRTIDTNPERILDAPDHNILDWGNEDIAAIALGETIYLWAHVSSKTTELNRTEDDPLSEVSCVKWDDNSFNSALAAGFENSEIRIFDVSQQKQLRTLKGHSGRINSIDWNGLTLGTGSSDSKICLWDLRIKEALISSVSEHVDEVCCLKWSPDRLHLASGGNNGKVFLFDHRNLEKSKLALQSHTAAVKALCWCRWDPMMLVTGGGGADCRLLFWDLLKGCVASSIQTQGQICGVDCAPKEKEVITIHSDPEPSVSVWNYPSMKLMANMEGVKSKALFLTLSPTGEKVMIGTSDEKIFIWKVFRSEELVEEESRQRKNMKDRFDDFEKSLFKKSFFPR